MTNLELNSTISSDLEKYDFKTTRKEKSIQVNLYISALKPP